MKSLFVFMLCLSCRYAETEIITDKEDIAEEAGVQDTKSALEWENNNDDPADDNLEDEFDDTPEE